MSEVQILQSVQQFMARQHGHFIDGKLVAAELLDKVDIVNPSTEQVVAQISVGSQQDVENAVKSAEHAFQNAWAETTPYERGVTRDAQAPGRQPDPAGAVRQAGRGVPHPPRRAARADRQFQPGAALGQLGALQRAR